MFSTKFMRIKISSKLKKNKNNNKKLQLDSNPQPFNYFVANMAHLPNALRSQSFQKSGNILSEHYLIEKTLVTDLTKFAPRAS